MESSKRKIRDYEITDYLVEKALKLQRKLDSNPNPFVWRKKIERDVLNGCVQPQLFSVKEHKKRAREREVEIEKLKRRRDERAIRKAQRDEEMALLARERARAEFDDWEKKEREFDLKQAKIRSEIRLREGRAKPMDVLRKYVDEFEGEAPYTVLKGLKGAEMEEVRDEVKDTLRASDGATPSRTRLWEAILVVCEWELVLKTLTLAGERDAFGLHTSVESDVERELEGKSYEELEVLQAQIESTMQSGAAKVVEYWEAVLKRLRFYKAKAYLKEIHSERCPHLYINAEARENDQEEERGAKEEDDGSHSPQLIAIDVDEDEDALDPEKDMAILENKRAAVVRGTGEEIEHEKYLPRKPKYHTRVHSGYEWNKYNQTHYDHDNPPPKTVLGYKFDIFYPDLLDRSRAPGFSVERDGESGETCILRFHAGAPYEDIAFRIVNKEWEYSRKKGFKSSFERGILHLYFNFKKYRYRR